MFESTVYEYIKNHLAINLFYFVGEEGEKNKFNKGHLPPIKVSFQS